MATDEESTPLGRVIGYHADRTLTGEQVAARISAYLYGNIIVFATLVPLLRDAKPSFRTLLSGLLLGAVAAGIALLKVALGH